VSVRPSDIFRYLRMEPTGPRRQCRYPRTGGLVAVVITYMMVK
jgi:hypothetical protein